MSQRKLNLDLHFAPPFSRAQKILLQLAKLKEMKLPEAKILRPHQLGFPTLHVLSVSCKFIFSLQQEAHERLMRALKTLNVIDMFVCLWEFQQCCSSRVSLIVAAYKSKRLLFNNQCRHKHSLYPKHRRNICDFSRQQTNLQQCLPLKQTSSYLRQIDTGTINRTSQPGCLPGRWNDPNIKTRHLISYV